MKKKIIIFDFDDTLTDNTERDFQSFQHIIKKFKLKSMNKNEIFNLRENSKTSEFIIKKIINFNNKKLYNECYQERLFFLERNLSYEKYVKLKFCALEILNRLKKDKYIIALNSIQSNHTNFLNILENFKIKNYFQEIVTDKLVSSNSSYQNRYNVKKKLYEKILNRLKINDPKDVLVVGNLFSDILPANSLGIDSIMIKGSFGFDNSQNHLINQILELEEIFKFI
jgi:phosphoglycolate phosphatase-like HAD superfamily hydrolase|tara:strand:+ start:687 stop:1364 length:678 start_codon:yes stop_codon:yes gene_type:complete